MGRISQYRGSLTFEHIADGMNRALQNAQRLVDDAQILFDQGRFPSAVALAILSIEESGKVPILRQMAIAGDDCECKRLWKSYRTHTDKNIWWIIGDLARSGARKLDDLFPMVAPGAEHPGMLDQLKQLCVYTDCFSNVKWSSPDEVEIRTLVPYLLTIARIFATPEPVSADSVEVYFRHMHPVRRGSVDTQREAMRAALRELVDRGLWDASPDAIDAFLAPCEGNPTR